jgi:hypothetical protein
MDIQTALKSQYHASLAMLRQEIERCPDELWAARNEPRPYWRIVYHTLFYAHLYLQPNESTFRCWEGHIEGRNRISPPEGTEANLTPYTQQQMLSYCDLCDAMVDEAVDHLDLNSPECGFSWYTMPKLDHQIVNIRHIHQHVGQLCERCYSKGIELDWIGKAIPV